LEVSKELVKPKQFWSLYSELMLDENDDHMINLLVEVGKTSEEYQTILANESPINEGD